MRVFISHSWKNKTQAQQIADELKAAKVDVWMDAGNLLPGQVIQETIDDVLGKVDVVILVWTKDASESKGVAAEIITSSKLKKIIIPCKIENASMDAFPYLRQVKSIHFNDFKGGIDRLKMVLLNYMGREFDMHENESIRSMNEFMGTLETAHHLIHKEDIKNKGTDEQKDYWVGKVQSTHADSFEKLKEEERIGKEVSAFLSEVMTQLQSKLNDKNNVGDVLQKMKQYKYATRSDFKKFITQVEAIYASFENDETDAAVARFRQEMETKLKASEQQLKNSMGWVGDLLFKVAFENARYFFLSSATHLEKLLQLSRQQGTHPVVIDCANELLKYIKTPGGVIDNNQYGILGNADDAYFIQSLLSNLQQEQLVDTSTWNIDWPKIQAGSEFVFNLVGVNIRHLLDQNILQYCHALVAKYNPAAQQQQLDALQQSKDDLWKAKLMSLQTAMIQSPVY